MGITVLVDDAREGYTAHVVLRTGSAALDLYPHIAKAAEVELLQMDHDLGVGPDGYDVLKMILNPDPRERRAAPFPRKVQLVTGNPVGRDRMKALLKDAGYWFNPENTTWYRQDT